MVFGESGQQVIDFAAEMTAEHVQVPENRLSDREYYDQLIRREGAGTYFCPNCGGIQHSAFYCAEECSPSHPRKVLGLVFDNFSIKSDLIRRKNPL